MAAPMAREDQDLLLKAAKLSQFAYTVADPAQSISIDPGEAANAIRGELIPGGFVPASENFHRFSTKQWFLSRQNTSRSYRSQAYFYHYRETNDGPNEIIIGFRGTWFDPSVRNTWHGNTKWGWTAIGNWFQKRFPPSNYSFSDIWYDATIVRIPYTSLTPIGKWWAFWGAVVLKWTYYPVKYFSWFGVDKLLYPARKCAADWIGNPHSPGRASELHTGEVHLGFWSLWASNEGFGGCNWAGAPVAIGRPLLTPGSEPLVLAAVQEAIGSTTPPRRTNILIVGHSLGGAVSSFAALDLVQRFGVQHAGSTQEIRINHVTFGSPPVGSVSFREYFAKEFADHGRHKSLSVYHEQDTVAGCFSWLSGMPLVNLFGWWGDWAHTGTRIKITGPPEPDAGAWYKRLWNAMVAFGGKLITKEFWKDLLPALSDAFWNAIFWFLTVVSVVVTILVLLVLNVLVIFIAYFWFCWSWLRDKERLRAVNIPPLWWGRTDMLSARGLRRSLDFSLKYHSMAEYRQHFEGPDHLRTTHVYSDGQWSDRRIL